LIATSAANVVAAAIARARREVRSHFETRNADSPAKAVAYAAPDRLHQRQFDLLVGRGILCSTGDGRYWLDREAIRREEERRREAFKKVLLVVIIAMIIAVAIAAVTMARGGRS